MNVLKNWKVEGIRALLNAMKKPSNREIARRIGVRPETVIKYAKEDSKPYKVATGENKVESVNKGQNENQGDSTNPLKAPRHARSACASHHEWIVEQLAYGRNAMAIYQDLVDYEGFTHKYNSVKRYVRWLKKTEPKVYDWLEFGPGEEAQVDYGEGAPTKHPKTGEYKKPRLFVMTLKYSRRSFRKVVWKSSQEVWARLHEEAFRYFGGAVSYVVLDNLKEGVIVPDIYEPEKNALYVAVLSHYGVVADPARVRDPNRKGTVENAIQHTQDTGLRGRKFETLEEQNEHLMHWEEKWVKTRIHGTTKKQVEKMFQEEKPHLKPLPLESFRYYREESRTVDDYGNVHIDNVYYSARPLPVFERAVVHIYDKEIEILNPHTLELVRRHVRSYTKGSVVREASDEVFNPMKKTLALLEKAACIGPGTLEISKILVETEGREGHRKMYGIVNLARDYPAADIEKAVGIALKNDVFSSRIIREMVKRWAENKRNRIKNNRPELIQVHELIRPPSDYGKFFEKHVGRKILKVTG